MDTRNTPPATCAAMGQDTERELRIEIRPYDLDLAEYYGTRAQLEAEGVIPKNTEWPRAAAELRWECGKFVFLLHRARPDGMRGPKKLWVEGDWWCLRWELINQPDHGTREIKRKARELEEAVYRASAAGRREWDAQWGRLQAARQDMAFQCFKDLLVPAPKKRGRPAKARQVADLSPSTDASGRA